MLEYLKQPEVGFILFAFLLSLILLIKSKKLLSFICTIIIALIGCGLIVLELLKVDVPNIGSLSIEVFADIICAVCVLIIVILLFKKEDKDQLFIESLNTLDKKVMAYLDNEGKLINFTSNFYEELNLDSKEKINKAVSEFFINNQKIEYQDLLNEFKENIGDDFKLTVVLKNYDLANEDGISFNLQKVAVEKEDKTLGFVIVMLEQSKNEEAVDGFSLVIDDLDIPYAYYNDSSKNVIYTINKKFKDLLGIFGRTVTYSELRRLVFSEDLSVFDAAASEMASNNTYCYRLKTYNGYKMFSEVKLTKGNHVTSIITLVDSKEEQYVSKNDMDQAIESLIKNNIEFAGIIISINSFIDIYNKRGVDVAKELKNKYIEFIKSEVLKENDLICKISDIEYLLLFKDITEVDKIIRDAQNGVSVLTKYQMNYGEEVLETNNTLGIVYSNENIKSAVDFIKALDVALAYANSDGYDKPYSIYNSYVNGNKTLQTKVLTNENSLDYSFDKIKINLDNSFLDDDEV